MLSVRRGQSSRLQTELKALEQKACPSNSRSPRSPGEASAISAPEAAVVEEARGGGGECGGADGGEERARLGRRSARAPPRRSVEAADRASDSSSRCSEARSAVPRWREPKTGAPAAAACTRGQHEEPLSPGLTMSIAEPRLTRYAKLDAEVGYQH